VEWVDEREGWDAVWKAVEMSGKIEVEGVSLSRVVFFSRDASLDRISLDSLDGEG